MPRLLPSSKFLKCSGPLKRQTTPAGALFVSQMCDKDDPMKQADAWIKGGLRSPEISQMFGSAKELLGWIVGKLVAAAITIFAVGRSEARTGSRLAGFR
jgi:hypothetical protein